MVRVPVSITVHVSVGMHVGSLVGHGDLPELRQAWRAGRDGAGAVEMFPLRAAAVLHDLLVLGALVLEPYFHLEEKIRPHVPEIIEGNLLCKTIM